MKEAGFQWAFFRTPPFTHPELPGYEFYLSTPEGVNHRRELAELVVKKGWNRIAIAESWLYTPPSYPLAVRVDRQFDLLPYQENMRAYYSMDEEVMEQIVRFIAHLEIPFDSPFGLPFLQSGKVAFLREPLYPRHLDAFTARFAAYLRPELAAKARTLWTSLLYAKEAEWPICHLSELLKKQIKPYLLSHDCPEGETLDSICTSPELFSDRSTFEKGGFETIGPALRYHSSQILVARHPALPGYLIKTYPLLGDYRDPYSRLDEYLGRCRQAKRLIDFVKERDLHQMEVPRKGIFRLSDRFTSPRAPDGKYLLIVEEIDLMEAQAAKRVEKALPIELMKELLQVYRYFGSADSSWTNHPITRDGKIAWVDTKHLGRGGCEKLLPFFHHMVGDERWEIALRYWEELI